MLMRKLRGLFSIATVAILFYSAGCKSKPETQKPDFSKLTGDFVYGSLALSPTNATQAGYHEHQGVKLDEKLDDYSPTGIQAAQNFYSDFKTRLAAIDQQALSAEDRADYQIIRNAIDLSLQDLQQVQGYRHNPTTYVELIGNALFAPYVLEYAPLDTRFGQIINRLTQVPALLDQAKTNLTDAPEIWNKVAREENDGNIDLIDKTLRSKAPANLTADFDKAATPALAALRSFNAYLKNDLSKKTSDWRLGKEEYARKFADMLIAAKTPEQVLAEAESALKETRDQMAKLAAPHSVREALDALARQHTTPDHFIEQASKDLELATAFVREKHLVTFPSRNNLQVIPTPEFMRGTYGVAGFNPAPAFEPQLGAFYWVTPIPGDWPRQRVESKLREYNRYGMMQITIHEAMPGHYVQFEVADSLEPKSRRALRNIYGNVPYVEGWALYTQQMMSEKGFMNNSKELQLAYYKQLLRSIANAILDIRLQTMGMTDQQALDLMMNDTFQEKEEATGKLQRAQLSSCQLPTYFVGLRGWLDAREEYKKRKGLAFVLSDFHDAALKESAVPLPTLEKLLQ
jgi:uncharacterized protein (DUF885 family)